MPAVTGPAAPPSTRRLRFGALRSTASGFLSSTAGSVVKLAGGTAAAQLLVVLLAPVVSRLYDPEDFGLLGVFVALVTILNVVGTLGYDQAIPLPAERLTALNLLCLGTLCNTVIVTTLFFVLIPFAQPLADALGSPSLAPYLQWLLPPTLFATGAYLLVSYWAVREKQYGWLARRNFTRGAAGVLTQTALGAVGVTPGGLLLGTAAGQSASSFGVARHILRDERALLRTVSTRGMLRAGHRYIRFPLYTSWSGLVNSAGPVVPLLVLSSFYGAQVTGWFTFTTRVVLVPVALVGDAVAHVYLGESAERYRHRPREMLPLFVRAAKGLLLIGTPPLVLLGLSGEWLFPWVFGPEWAEAGVYALLLLPMYLAQFVVFPMASTLSVLERQGQQLAWDAVRLALATGSLYVPWLLGYGPRVTVLCYSVAMCVAYMGLWLLAFRALRQTVSEPS